MADRRCPYCGELVPSNSITCPKCFKKIPVEPEAVRREERRREDSQRPGIGGRQYNRTIALVLAIIPGLFGLLGLGLIYKNPRSKIGYLALVFGLLFFIAAVLFTVSIIMIFVAVPCWIIYALMFIFSLALTVMDFSAFRMF